MSSSAISRGHRFRITWGAWALALGLAAPLACAQPAPAAASQPQAQQGPGQAQPPLFTRTLANGMQLVVKVDRRAPTAVHMVWLRAGAFDEPEGASGVAHALEHMMFKGTRRLQPGEFSRRVAGLGGQENAFTSMDYTGYYQQIPKGRLAEMMALEADRFANNHWPDDEFDKEIAVIKEERRMRTDDNPRSRLYELVNATAFIASPVRRPVIGWMGDLDHMTPQDVRDFHQQWYVPGNAAIVVAGDVDPEEVWRIAQRTYGRIPARALALPGQAAAKTGAQAGKKAAAAPEAAPPVRRATPEPAQQGMRRVSLKAPAEQAYVMLAFKVPKLQGTPAGLVDGPDTRDALALTVLSAVLDGYSGARLDRALTQGPDRVADSASSGNGLLGRGPQQFYLMGVPAAGKTAEQVEAALRAEVARVAEHGISEQELARVKTQWTAGQVYELDSLMNQARELGAAWVQALPLDLNPALVAALNRVTAQQVQDVAKRYFGDDGLTVGTLIPVAGAAPRAAGGAAPAGELH